MSPRVALNSSLQFIRARRLWLLIAGVVLVLLSIIFWPRAPRQAANATYQIKRSDFLISVIEGGTLQAVNEVNIRNEVEGISRIIMIVPEGSYVKKGDLLVELDSSNARDAVNLQLIAVEKQQFGVTQAKEQLQIQKSIAESEIRTAELRLEFAQSDLEKYLEGEYKQIHRKCEIDIATLQEKQKIDEDRYEWSKKLAEKGFETKSNLEKDQLTLHQTKLALETATNALWMVEQFDYPKRKRLLESNVDEAKSDLARIKLQTDRKLASYEADLHTQEITLDLGKAKLERDQKNLAACKVFAPQDGMVVYPSSEGFYSSESMIEEGATVRNRQILIKLPDVSEMKVTVKVHESHINMIQLGQPAFVVLDSMPDQRFNGSVSHINLLPDTQSRYGNPNLKVYATEILVTDPLPDIKPGVSARAEIVVTNLQNVISVPIQVVATKQGRPVVYVGGGTEPKPTPVAIGMYNTKMIEITAGLREGDRVLLAPPFDMQEKDIGGAILGESDKETATNRLHSSKMTAPKKTGKKGGVRSGEGNPKADRAPRPADGAPKPERGGPGPGKKNLQSSVEEPHAKSGS